MQGILFWIALSTFLVTFVAVVRAFLGNRKIQTLPNISKQLPENPPSVTIVVAARNEARNIRPALESLLNLDYSGLQWIILDDRSTDGTSQILAAFAKQNRQIQIRTVTRLPPGWLGKNHALHVGAKKADTDFILFTDADVQFDSSAISRGMHYAIANDLDHLTMVPHLTMRGWLLNGLAITFSLLFFSFFSPWKARQSNSSASTGIGAFNLVRRTAYEEIGGHSSIRMRPDDDLKLGKILKQAGFRQDLVKGADMLRVPWYASVGEFIRGLEKNAFSGVDYSVFVTVVSSLLVLSMHVWPFVAILVTDGSTWYLNLATILVLFAAAFGIGRIINASTWSFLSYPFSACMFVYIQWRTMVLNLWNQGIHWRDTFYSLKDLKSNRV